MVRRLATPAPPQWYGLNGGEGGGGQGRGPGTHGGLRGLLGTSLHPNLDPKALQKTEPRHETYTIVCHSIRFRASCSCLVEKFTTDHLGH